MGEVGLLDLPREILAYIIDMTDEEDVVMSALSCKYLYDVVRSQSEVYRLRHRFGLSTDITYKKAVRLGPNCKWLSNMQVKLESDDTFTRSLCKRITYVIAPTDMHGLHLFTECKYMRVAKIHKSKRLCSMI
jgi:hypothetical protein